MQTRPELADMPDRLRGRPIDHRGFPVPWFVTNKTDAGLWDFVRINEARKNEALRKRVCWVSGERLGRAVAFVVGPMCIINRVASDPPIIPEIAEWSARICPFLSRPLAKRPDWDGDQRATPGVLVPDNPGLCAVWVTRDYEMSTRDYGVIHFWEPQRVTWWRKGEDVTHSQEARNIYEARAAVLEESAIQEGPGAHRFFLKLKAASDRYAPMGEFHG